MDSDSFFGFDAAAHHDEEDLEDDDDYNAVNDETFGAAAVGGDWEENHKQLSSLTEAERLHRAVGKGVRGSREPVGSDYYLQQLPSPTHDLEKALESLGFDGSGEKKRLFERSVGSSPLIGIGIASSQRSSEELSISPGNSIWSPTTTTNRFTTLDRLRHQFTVSPGGIQSPLAPAPFDNSSSSFSIQVQPQGPGVTTNGLPLLRSNTAPILPDFGHLLRPAMKTVSELEDELKRQHSNTGRFQSMTVEDLERELSKQTTNLNKGNASAAQFSNNFPSPRMVPGPGQSLLHSQHYQQNKMQTPPSSVLPPHNIIAAASKPSGNLPYPYPFLNKGMSSAFPHPPPGVYPPGGRPGVSAFLHQGNSMVGGNKGGAGGIFQGGVNHGRNQAHHKPNVYERQFDFLFGSPHSHHHNQHEKRGPQVPAPNSGGRVRRDSDAEWEEWQRVRQADEYAGLMTPREKSWLRNIQALQLHTDNPYQDDYYFVMHKAKQQRRREEEALEMDGLQLHLVSEQQQQQQRFLIGSSGRDGVAGSKEGSYEPPKLENSLGKLQVASVNAPRKIIDLQVVHLDASHPTTSLQRDMRRHRHLLLHAEKLYTLQIELDDLERKIRALPDCPTRDSFRSKCRQLVTRLWVGLTAPHESFVQLLCIRKGKTLAARLLSWVGREEMEHFLATVVQNLPLLTKRDTHDSRMPLFWPFADRFISQAVPPTLLSFGVMMGPQLKTHKQHFIPAVASKLGLSFVLGMLLRGEQLWEELKDDPTWQQFLHDTTHGLASLSSPGSRSSNDTAKPGASPIQPLPSVTLAASPTSLSAHLIRCREAPGTTALPPEFTEALEVLKGFESLLNKTAPPPKPSAHGSSSPASPSFDPRNQRPSGLSHLQQAPAALS